MRIGDRIVLTECVLVIAGRRHDSLPAGTEGTVTGVSGPLLSIRTAGGVYDDIPASSVKQLQEDRAA